MTMTETKPKPITCDGLDWVQGEERPCGKLLAKQFEDRIEIKCKCGNKHVVWLKGVGR